MKAVLISIQPKWVEKIANGEKTIEVRKTKPKSETPFKVYIYCTKEKSIYDMLLISNEKGFEKSVSFGDYRNHGFGWEIGNGKVIGEFVCEDIDDFSKWEFDYPSLLRHINLFAGTKGDYKFLDDYLKGQRKGYGWHISDLKIYDKPKELSEFEKPCNFKWECSLCERYDRREHKCYKAIKRPPQSWCYVEEVQE